MNRGQKIALGIGVVGGTALAISALSKGAKAAPPTPPAEVAAVVSRLSLFSVAPDGQRFPLTPRFLMEYTHSAPLGGVAQEVPGYLYAWTVSGEQRGLGAERENPEAEMSIWLDDRGWVMAFMQDSAWDVQVAWDGVSVLTLSGLCRSLIRK